MENKNSKVYADEKYNYSVNSKAQQKVNEFKKGEQENLKRKSMEISTRTAYFNNLNNHHHGVNKHSNNHHSGAQESEASYTGILNTLLPKSTTSLALKTQQYRIFYNDKRNLTGSTIAGKMKAQTPTNNIHPITPMNGIMHSNIAQNPNNMNLNSLSHTHTLQQHTQHKPNLNHNSHLPPHPHSHSHAQPSQQQHHHSQPHPQTAQSQQQTQNQPQAQSQSQAQSHSHSQKDNTRNSTCHQSQHQSNGFISKMQNSTHTHLPSHMGAHCSKSQKGRDMAHMAHSNTDGSCSNVETQSDENCKTNCAGSGMGRKNLEIKIPDHSPNAQNLFNKLKQFKSLSTRNSTIEAVTPEQKLPLTLQPGHKIIIPNHEPTKCSLKRNGVVRAYAANTNQGLVR